MKRSPRSLPSARSIVRRAVVTAGLALAGCGGGPVQTVDAHVPADANIPGFEAFAPCNAASEYVADPTGANIVMFGPASVYTPRCITIPVGDQVTFTGNFATHPLHPSTRGDAGNPIPSVGPATPPTEQLVVFGNPGFYPFYCDVHGSDDGSAMSGVVWVQD